MNPFLRFDMALPFGRSCPNLDLELGTKLLCMRLLTLQAPIPRMGSVIDQLSRHSDTSQPIVNCNWVSDLRFSSLANQTDVKSTKSAVTGASRPNKFRTTRAACPFTSITSPSKSENAPCTKRAVSPTLTARRALTLRRTGPATRVQLNCRMIRRIAASDNAIGFPPVPMTPATRSMAISCAQPRTCRPHSSSTMGMPTNIQSASNGIATKCFSLVKRFLMRQSSLIGRKTSNPARFSRYSGRKTRLPVPLTVR
mmetsp:Transcript_22283/g.35478  ORF Transcript_22283/g.35478 Transcript_22283/m.35478 type:complete len:254 (+) Transcript_22283:5545-6306(+)